MLGGKEWRIDMGTPLIESLILVFGDQAGVRWCA